MVGGLVERMVNMENGWKSSGQSRESVGIVWLEKNSSALLPSSFFGTTLFPDSKLCQYVGLTSGRLPSRLLGPPSCSL